MTDRTSLDWLAMLACALPVSCAAAAEPNVAELLKSLPEAELAIKDTVDHWGLPFADQLRRFRRGQESWQALFRGEGPEDFMLGTQHGLEKIPRNKYWFKGNYGNQIHLSAARNESESFQVAVMPDVGRTLRRVTLAPGPLRQEKGAGVIPVEALTIYRVGYGETVPAQYPVPYAGAWPDVLLPNAPMAIGGLDPGLFWVDVKVPRDAAAGDYHGRLALEADGRSVPVEVYLTVRGFALPDRVPFPIAVWCGSTPTTSTATRRGS